MHFVVARNLQGIIVLSEFNLLAMSRGRLSVGCHAGYSVAVMAHER